MTATAVIATVLLQATLSIWLIHRQIVAAGTRRSTVPEVFRETVDVPAREQAADLMIARMRAARIAAVTTALATLALSLGGGVAMIDQGWQTASLSPILHGTAVIASVLVIQQLVIALNAAWRVFISEAAFRVNRMTPMLFIGDVLKRILLHGVWLIPLLVASLAIFDDIGIWWWLPAWFGWLAVEIVRTTIAPHTIAPIFNRFTPLPDDGLRRKIESVLAMYGLRADALLVMDGSRRSAMGNASCTAFGRSARIVVLDTLMARLDAAELEAVLTHEIGHLALGHHHRRLIADGAAMLLALALLTMLLQLPGTLASFAIDEASLHNTLALAAVLLPVIRFYAAPLLNRMARQQELEADDFAARNSSTGATADALMKIHRDNRAELDPDPLWWNFFASHPAPIERLTRLASRHTA